MEVAENRYQVRATAYVLGVTPDLIYSFFKDRHSKVEGGMTESQFWAVVRHVEENKARPKPYKNKSSEVVKVQMALQNRPNTQQFMLISDENENAGDNPSCADTPTS